MEFFVTSTTELCNKDNIRDLIVKNLFSEESLMFLLEDSKASLFENITTNISKLINSLRSNLCVVIETNYVDKDYRDSYYRYYSTKLAQYNRNCIKLSFFEPETKDLLSDLSKLSISGNYKRVQNQYLGFVVIRPITQCIGRNIISPKAKNGDKDLLICGTFVKTSCMGIKLDVWGFPHASQDGEMMTCAETAVWAISEYFGEKYSTYSRIFPHKILDLLHDTSCQRQLPSIGLTYDMISLALLKQGLDCKVYHKDNPMFKELFTCYVESGFPLVVAIDGGNFGHAIVCVGRKEIIRSEITKQNLVEFGGDKCKKKGYFWNKCIDKFIANDDNLSPYEVFSFDSPMGHYDKTKFSHYDINNTNVVSFIVPLHSKIYTEAEKAIELSNTIISYESKVYTPIVRTFLTTSRSYKEYILLNGDINIEDKKMLLQKDTPKFLWITEISNINSFNKNKVDEMILIDPTAGSTSGVESMIAYYRFHYPIPSFNNLKAER